MSWTSGGSQTSAQPWRAVRWIVAALLAVSALWLSIQQIDWADLGARLATAHLPLLALALVTVLATTVAKAARWQVLLHSSQVSASGLRVLRLLLIGQLGNSFLPARLGDIARAALLSPQAHAGFPAVLGTILAEKALDGLLGLLVLVGLALWTPLPAWLHQPVLVLALLTGGLLLLVLIAGRGTGLSTGWGWAADRLPATIAAWIGRVSARFAVGLDLFHHPGRAALALSWSVVVWCLAASTNAVTLAALDIDAPGWSIWLVLVTGYVANFLPTVPGQIGVFEYACVLALTAAGVGPEAALAFGLVLHLIVYAPPAFLGPISLAVEGVSWSSLRRLQRQFQEGNRAPS